MCSLLCDPCGVQCVILVGRFYWPVLAIALWPSMRGFVLAWLVMLSSGRANTEHCGTLAKLKALKVDAEIAV